MSIRLNRQGFAYAKKVIKADEVEHKAGSWSHDKPTKDEISKFLNTHYPEEYGLWFLGINTDIDKESRQHYCFPYGDLKIVHKDAVLASLKSAEDQGLTEIADAARELLKLIDSAK